MTMVVMMEMMVMDWVLLYLDMSTVMANRIFFYRSNQDQPNMASILAYRYHRVQEHIK